MLWLVALVLVVRGGGALVHEGVQAALLLEVVWQGGGCLINASAGDHAWWRLLLSPAQWHSSLGTSLQFSGRACALGLEGFPIAYAGGAQAALQGVSVGPGAAWQCTERWVQQYDLLWHFSCCFQALLQQYDLFRHFWAVSGSAALVLPDAMRCSELWW